MTELDPSAEQALARAVAALWERHRPTALERVAVLERAGEAAARGALGEPLSAQARAEAHKLAGSLGSFGVHDGTVLAREAERLLEPGAEDGARLRGVAAELRAVVETAVARPE